MKRGIYLAVFTLALSIFIVNFVSANIYIPPPQPVTCSNSSINTIWGSIFQVNSSGIKVLINKSIPDYCLSFKTEGADFYYMRITSEGIGNFTNTTNVTYGNYTEIYAWHTKISSAQADSLKNNVSNLTGFVEWNFLYNLAKTEEASNSTMISPSVANSEFTSTFKITPPSWQLNSGNVYYFGAETSAFGSLIDIPNITKNTNAFTSSSGNVYGDGSEEHFIFSSYVLYNSSAQSSTVQNSTSAPSQTQNSSQSNSSSNLFFYLVVGIIVLLIIGLLIYLIVSHKKAPPQTTVRDQNSQPAMTNTATTNSS